MKKTEHNILVVEDERPLLNAISKRLEAAGYMVLTARSAEQAYGYLEDVEGIDVVWLDHYLLGKENGLDILTYLKGPDSKYRDLPVFVVSNTASDKSVKSYMALGAEKYYLKMEHRLDEIIGDIESLLSEEKV
ncbi:MAG: response regulator [Patescibacteria group bacterium]